MAVTEPDTKAQAAQSPTERLQAAGQAFGEVNRTLPAGLAPFQLPDLLEPTSALDALVRILIAKDVIDEQEFVAHKITRMAEIVEEITESARQLKRQATGLVIAGPGQPV